MTATSSQTPLARLATAPRWAIRLGAIVAGLVVNVIFVLIVTRVVGYDLMTPAVFDKPAAPIEIGAVIGASVVPALLGWALLGLLERFVPKYGLLIWTALALVLLIGGLPWNGTGVTVLDQVLLGVMHLVVGAAVIPAFRATSPTR